jgi:hypothetical protein
MVYGFIVPANYVGRDFGRILIGQASGGGRAQDA